MLKYCLYPACILCLLQGCKKISRDQLFVVRDPSGTGLLFQNTLAESAGFNILNYLYYYNGGGVSIGDINNDGWDDVFLVANLGENRLFINKGGLQFQDITRQAGVGGQYGWSTGTNMVDINGDGFLDIYVCNLGDFEGKTGKNELFINNANGTFTESATEYGLDFSTFSTQSVFFDYDRDGDLDMYLLNHAIHTVKAYVPREKVKGQFDGLSGDRLLRNNAEIGNTLFTDVTAGSGIHSNSIGFGLGVAACDINRDGWTDLYISNDFHENDYLYINNGNGTFHDQHAQWFGHSSKYSMGSDVSDVNNDGLPDLMTLDMLPELPRVLQKSMAEDHYALKEIILENGYAPQLARNTLQLNRNGRFSDVAPLMGVEASDWSWSPLFADLDNDGDKDLYITNGIYRRPNDMDYLNYTSNSAIRAVMEQQNASISRKLIELMPQLKIPNKVFANLEGKKFEDKTKPWGLDIPSYSSGVAYSDLDNDGDLDMVVNNINEPAFLIENLSNEKKSEHRSLRVRLHGRSPNTSGIGAKVMVECGVGALYQEQYPVRGFMSSVSPIIHFGVGTADEVRQVKVVWPDGTFEIQTGLASNGLYEFYQQNASGNDYEKPKATKDVLFTKSYDLDLPRHRENIYHDVYAEYLIPRLISREGPGLAVGDVNNDGLQDLFITGASGHPAQLLVQDWRGKLQLSSQPAFSEVLQAEGVDAAFFDADGDRDLDLYVATAGNESAADPGTLQDQFYRNDGIGNFIRQADITLPVGQHAIVRPADFDKDGDIDLFIGGRVVHGEYGAVPASHLLVNDGTGSFQPLLVPGLNHVGMVTDAVWVDLGPNGWQDLVVVGEWMPIVIFENEKGMLREINQPQGLENTRGWWNCIVAGDFDGDGDFDMVAGNAGMNMKISVSPEEPVTLYLNDFDQNGSLDQVLAHFIGGKEYPLATKDQLARQLPSTRKKFPTYHSFAGATVRDIFEPGKLEEAKKLTAVEFSSLYIENKDDWQFEVRGLPFTVNLSSVQAIEVVDLNADGFKDIIGAGNFYHLVPPLGRQDASIGFVGINDRAGNFTIMDHDLSGLILDGEVREMKWLRSTKGRHYLLTARNNDKMLAHQLKGD